MTEISYITTREGEAKSLSLRKIPFTVPEILGPKGLFEKKIPGFKPRQGQLELACKVEQTLHDGQICIAEAGTGTGKTYAYLIPALLSEKVTVVSTASKALQDQLMYKDLPALFEYLGLPPEFMVLKGFSNYLCLKKAWEFISKYGESEIFADEQLLDSQHRKLRQYAKAIKQLIEQTELAIEKREPLCDFAEVNSRFPHEIASAITIDAKLCKSLGRCRYATHCFPILARTKATASRLVIVNHALFFAALNVDDVFDPIKPPIILPKYSNIIFDEAHELPQIGRSFLSLHVGSDDVEMLEKQMQILLESTPELPRNVLSDAMFRIRTSFKNMQLYLKGRFGPHRTERYEILQLMYEDFKPDNSDPTFKYQSRHEDFWRLSREIYKALETTRHFLDDNEDFNSELFLPLSSEIYQLEHTLTLLMNIDKPDSEEYGSYVGYCDLSSQHFELKLTPLEISKIFGQYLKQCEKHGLGVVMTSATLSVANTCKKFKQDLGASAQVDELIVPSHFDYQHQACLFVSKQFPPTSDENRMEKILKELKALIDLTPGGIFILTTSIAAVQLTAQYLRTLKPGRRIYEQNTTLSNTEMLQSFKHDGRAILVGTSSFWAGVDVPGSALSLVIIDKLPFDPPTDPLLKARLNWYDFKQGKRKKASFWDLYLPETVINLRQGVGRLVRSDKDQGAMVICDPRILAKGYGKIFLNSLPPMQRCNTLEETLNFMLKLGNANDESACP